MSWLMPWRKGPRGSHPLVNLQEEMNSLFDSLWRGDYDVSNVLRRGWAPALDVSETENEVIVKAEVPGIDPKDLDISVTGNVLTIKGEKREEKKEEAGKEWRRVERSYGSFSRSVELPEVVDVDNVAAECREGILTVTLAKKPESKAKKVDIQVE